MSAKTLGALAESIGASATDVGDQAGAIGEFIKNNYSSLTDEQKAQLTTIAGSLKTDVENLGGYAQSVGGQAKNLGTYAGSIGTSLQETLSVCVLIFINSFVIPVCALCKLDCNFS